MAKNTFDKGVGNIARAHATGERPTPSEVQQTTGFFIGTVMDDADDLKNGRIWVYIPGESAINPEYRVPRGGSAPDRITGRTNPAEFSKVRLGWVLCSPLMPYFGSDANRVTFGARNAYSDGDINSYGFWTQPRIGDEVGVLRSHNDPNKAYWFGGVVKPTANFSVPGVSGVDILRVDDSKLPQIPESILPGGLNLSTDVLIPILERVVYNDQDKNTGDVLRNAYPATSYFFNLLRAGLLCDAFRGTGSSSARRESPSYVTGLKSPGWNFDSEKTNVNSTTGLKFDGGQVGEPFTPTALNNYVNVNTTGHQIVMDDHPDHQGIRIRTSAGSQIYFNDGGVTNSPTEAFIFVNTPSGSVWIELQDRGNINVYSQGSASVHAGGDINLTADRDINIEAGGSLKMKAAGSHYLEVQGASNYTIGGPILISSSGFHANAFPGGFNVGGQDVNITAISGIKASSAAGNIDLSAGLSTNIQGTLDVNILASKAINETAGLQVAVTTLQYFESAIGGIFMNSGAGAPASPAAAASPPSAPTTAPTNQVPAAPSLSEIFNCIEPAAVEEKIGSIVPQHQPWPGRVTARAGGDTTEDEGFLARAGATFSSATKPLDVYGKIKGQADALYHQAKDYTTSSVAELPSFDSLSLPDGKLFDASNLSLSDAGKAFIKAKEGLVTDRAYLDAGKAWAIGYGHNIGIGDVINGKTVDQKFIDELSRTNGAALSITEEEADRLFDTDVARFETGVREGVTDPISQGQFDAMTSFAYNVGVSKFKQSTMLKKFNSGNLDEVPNEWMKWVKSEGRRNPGLVSRRREELEQFFSV